MEKTTRIFLTGATGILGRELVPRLLEAGYTLRALDRSQGKKRQQVPGWQEVEWIDGDILDILLLEKALEDVAFVIHAAALVSFHPGDRKLLHTINVEGTANMVNACLHAGTVQKLIHVSSVAALSPSKPLPTEVDERQGFNPDSRTSDYAWSKHRAELEVFRGVEEGIKAVLINPSIILAPSGPTESSGQLLEYARKDRIFYPSGWLNYVDVRDVVQVMLAMLVTETESGQRLVLNGGTVPYSDFFQLAARKTGKKAPYAESPRWLTEVLWRLSETWAAISGTKPLLTRFTASASARRLKYQSVRLPEILPDFSFTSLENTLENVLSPQKLRNAARVKNGEG